MDGAVFLNSILGYLEPVVISVCLFVFFCSIKRDIYKKPAVYFTVALLYTAGLIITSIAVSTNNAYSVLFQLICGSSIGYFLYHKSRMQIFYTVCYVITLFLIQALLVYFLMDYLWKMQMLSQMSKGFPYAAANLTLLTKAVMVVVLTKLWILFINRRGITGLSKLGYLSLFIPLAVSVFLVFAIVRISSVHVQLYGPGTLVLALLLVVVLNGCFIYLLSYVAKSGRLDRELSLLKTENELQFQYYETLEGKYRDSRKFIHDVRNHMQVLEEVYRSGNTQGAQKYREELMETLDSVDHTVYSSNRMVNIVLNEKLREAKEAGIATDIQMGDIPLDRMKDTDITVIFSNLLDNAIEAAGIQSDGAYLHIRAGRFHDFLVVRIENSIASMGNEPDNRSVHNGYGLINVKRALETYGGSLEIKSSAESYQVSVNVPL